MTIHSQDIPNLGRLSKYFLARMLMLGDTASAVPEFPTAQDYFGRWVGGAYETLDLDGGDLQLDLNGDVGLSQSHQTVFNLGTLEHVWNAHNAWANALRAVAVGAHFLSHSPISGYVDHGLHITSRPAILAFIAKNGFDVVEEWITRRKIGDILWLAAVKRRHIESLADFEPAWQVYEAGQKKAMR